MSKRLLIALGACLLVASGCNIIYKQNIQQGNALEQEDLDQLELGMTKNQVHFLLGTPAIRDPFHHDRWDYVSTFSRRGGDPVRRLVTLSFENDRLVRMEGVDEFTGDEVLGEAGPAPLRPVVAPTGTRSADARDYVGLEPVADDSDTWKLQMGAFSSRTEAEAQIAELARDGIEARIFTQATGKATFFVVRHGTFATREAALAALEDFERRTALRPFLVTPGS